MLRVLIKNWCSDETLILCSEISRTNRTLHLYWNNGSRQSCQITCDNAEQAKEILQKLLQTGYADLTQFPTDKKIT